MLKPFAFATSLFLLGHAYGQAVPPGSMSVAVPAQSTVEAAHLAWRSYNTGKPEIPTGYTDEAGARAAKLYAPPGFKIVGAQNDAASGFQAIAYQRTDGSGKTTIAIRGTDEALNDLGRADVVGIGMREVVATSRIPLVNPIEPMPGASTPLVNPAAVLLNTSITAANSEIERQLWDGAVLHIESKPIAANSSFRARIARAVSRRRILLELISLPFSVTSGSAIAHINPSIT